MKNLRTHAAIVAVSFAWLGCSAATESPGSEQELASYEASETARQFQVHSWNVFNEAQGVRIEGVDAKGQITVEAHIEQGASGEQLLRFAHPFEGLVKLDDKGAIDGLASLDPELEKLATALHDDIGFSVDEVREGADPGADLQLEEDYRIRCPSCYRYSCGLRCRTECVPFNGTCYWSRVCSRTCWCRFVCI